MLDVADEHDYPVWRALALVLHGVAMAGLGRPDEGLARTDQGFAIYKGLKAPPVFWPFILSLRGRAFALGGRPAEALDPIDEALAILGGGEGDLFYPEFPILKGDLLLALADPGGAETWYQEAFAAAGKVGARTAQLRAATRLTRLRPRSGNESGESETLRRVYESFTEGFETPDLVEARAVLDSVHVSESPETG